MTSAAEEVIAPAYPQRQAGDEITTHTKVPLIAAKPRSSQRPDNREGGHDDVVDVTPALPLIQEGWVKALAVTQPTRVKVLPDVPTIAEAALPGYSAMMAYLAPSVQDKLVALGMDLSTSTPDELKHHIASDQTILQNSHCRICDAGFAHVGRRSQISVADAGGGGHRSDAGRRDGP